MPPGINNSLIMLIPKSEGAQRLTDFKPISLVVCLYKIIAKTLAEGLKPALPSLISQTQNAFIKGRQILDCVLITYETIHLLKRKKMPRFLPKLNFEKAFDFVNWSYLEDIMVYMGFGSTWRRWILQRALLRGGRGLGNISHDSGG